MSESNNCLISSAAQTFPIPLDRNGAVHRYFLGPARAPSYTPGEEEKKAMNRRPRFIRFTSRGA